jgi:hypothetical protein
VCTAHNIRLCKECKKLVSPITEARKMKRGEAMDPLVLSSGEPVWKYVGSAWRCIAHDKTMCTLCHRNVHKPGRKGDHQGQVWPTTEFTTGGPRQKLSSVGVRTESGLACPNCGGMQFTAKRSVKGKLLAPAWGLTAPKSQVRCVACGTMFKRG